MSGVRAWLSCFALAGSLAAVAGACSPARSSPSGSSVGATPTAPGTYEIAVCRSWPCAPRDTVAAYLLATLVLFDNAGAEREDLPPAAYEGGLRATACFSVRYRRRVASSYAGISAREYFIWHHVEDDIAFLLYRSPDAFYAVRARLTADGFEGGGTSSGAGAARIDAPRDTVVARRTGPPERLRCHVPG